MSVSSIGDVLAWAQDGESDDNFDSTSLDSTMDTQRLVGHRPMDSLCTPPGSDNEDETVEQRIMQLGCGALGIAEEAEEANPVERIIFTFIEAGPFGIRFNGQGVVTRVEPGGQAAGLGFMEDDKIVEVAGIVITDKTLIPNLKVLPRPGE